MSKTSTCIDIVVVIDVSLHSISEAFLKLDEQTYKIGLRINEGKTKIMMSGRKRDVQS